VLIQLTFIILMLFGIAALTIDVGIARLTQVQMQSAADTAALEGLRQRDAAGGDAGRRTAACQMAAWTFDDAFQDHCSAGANPTAPSLRLGAGPEFAMNNSGLALNASQTIDVAASGVYLPVLQSNPFANGVGNNPEGDMVSGTFAGNSDLYPEDSQYNRTDFAPAGGSATNVAEAPSFLVRLRRTDGRNPLDRDSNPDPTQGVSSSGGSLPFLFGRGLPMHSDPASTYDPRVNGMTVRATAITNGQPALRVGPPSAAVTPPLPGWGTVAVERGAWMTLLPHDGSSIELTLGGGGVLTFGGTPVGQAIQAAGAITVGDPITGAGAVIAPQCGLPPVPDACGPPGMGTGMNAYVPVYDSVSNLVTGFGFASVCEIPGTPTLVTIAPVNAHVACANATALVPGGLAGPIANLGQTSLFVSVLVH